MDIHEEVTVFEAKAQIAATEDEAVDGVVELEVASFGADEETVDADAVDDTAEEVDVAEAAESDDDDAGADVAETVEASVASFETEVDDTVEDQAGDAEEQGLAEVAADQPESTSEESVD